MGLLDILFPKRCVQCKKTGEYVCANCFAQLSFEVKHICLVCNGWSIDGLTHPGCMGKYSIDGAFCGLVYNRVMKRLIYVFKYEPYVSDLGKFLTQLLYEGLIQQEHLVKISQKYTPIFIPVPLSAKKFNKRGYNQAKILAKGLANIFHAEMIDCLERITDTKPQFGLKREERKVNMKGAFKMKKFEIRNSKHETNSNDRNLNDKNKIQNRKGFEPSNFGNLNIVSDFDIRYSDLSPSAFLVDDLLTTGTTLLEAANVLKRNGFKNVWGLCLARDQ